MSLTTAQTHDPDGRPRARALGIPLRGTPGPLNAITDVTGVAVGTVTLVSGDGPLVVGEGPVRTGVTAILPRGHDGIGVPCAAGWYSLNGNGEMTGTTWIEEVGALSTPIAITNTHAVGPTHEGVIQWTLRNGSGSSDLWLLPVVAETYDGDLNDINGRHVRPEHVEEALDAAVAGPIANGSVGGGTGMNCYEYKGGTGDCVARRASRVAGLRRRRPPAGQLRLTGRADRGRRTGWPRAARRQSPRGAVRTEGRPHGSGPGRSRFGHRGGGHRCTVAPRSVQGVGAPGAAGSRAHRHARRALLRRHLPRVLHRERRSLQSTLPLDVSTDDDYETMRFVPWGHIDPFYSAVVEAVEEAVLNALVVNEDMIGRDGHRSPALPRERVLALLRERLHPSDA